MRDKSIRELLESYPYLESFFSNNAVETEGNEELTLRQAVELLPVETRQEYALDVPSLEQNMELFIEQMQQFLSDEDDQVHTISIFPGTDKSGLAETFERLDLRPGEVTCIVGPTGSGKSRLLADIEWVAQKDTPTHRLVLVNDEPPQHKWRFSISDKLVAQLSQNMNFVMDLSVEEFVTLHAESRMTEDTQAAVEKIIEKANELAGEQFHRSTQITSLSGGQSRALMIADTAVLSRSPVILIDEIENAGIDRKQALKLLLSEQKIVLMATHDPMLALLGDRRIVIRNGGIADIIETTDEERFMLGELEKLDSRINELRNRLRSGHRLHAE
jgi:ABC-type lipoprotein export system ATPase subunit